MSTTTKSKSTQDKRVKSPVDNIASKSEYEVSSCDKSNDFKIEHKSNEGTKENTKTTAVPTKKLPFHDKLDSKSTETKMDSDSTSRNPLAESIPSNNDLNRKMANGGENKSTKTPVNVQDETNHKNNPKLRVRASKKSASPPRLLECGWCEESKLNLEYIMPTLSGEIHKFCSKICLAKFRNVVKEASSCKKCGSIVRSTGTPNKEYCSSYCMIKATPKNGNILN